MIATEPFLGDGEVAFVERLGLGVAPHMAVGLGKIVERHTDFRMIFPVARFGNGHRALSVQPATGVVRFMPPLVFQGLCDLIGVAAHELGLVNATVPSEYGGSGFPELDNALIAEQLAPGARLWWQAGHLSTEPAHALALAQLGLDPILDLKMRLGEGTGAAVALPVLRAAVAALSSMATFAEANVTDRPTVS